MAKRGQRIPFRVIFSYPPSDRCPDGITTSRAPFHEKCSAIKLRDDVISRGGTAIAVRIEPDGTETEL